VRYDSPYFLPLEKAAVVLNGVKLMTDIWREVHVQLGMEEAEWFYTKLCNIVNVVNKGGLGWFSQWNGRLLDAALKSKAEMFQLWLSKQCIGICATRKNMKGVQDLLVDKCQNCHHPRETSNHLNRYPKAGQHCSFKIAQPL
jgi:hypothetical protein